METFKSLYEAVEENNEMNQAEWSDWENAKHIQQVYGNLYDDERKFMSQAFLNDLIRNNGKNAVVYLDLINTLDYANEI